MKSANMMDVDALQPDFIGMIFYNHSLRFIGENVTPETNTSKVGVFVNNSLHYIIQQARKHNFSHIQLHGSENVILVKELHQNGYKVIKSFSIEHAIDNSIMNAYAPFCTYFLFDTKGSNHGGTGVKFNWRLLPDYQLDTPFILSGGIGPGDVALLKNINHPALAGIDINSRFEISPGLKNIELLKLFINEIRKEQN